MRGALVSAQLYIFFKQCCYWSYKIRKFNGDKKRSNAMKKSIICNIFYPISFHRGQRMVRKKDLKRFARK